MGADSHWGMTRQREGQWCSSTTPSSLWECITLTRPCTETFFAVSEKLSSVNVLSLEVWTLAAPQ